MRIIVKIVGLTATSLALSSINSVLMAEESRGRLSDGRAFRTTSDGIQLVDDLAEMQLTVETLNRRLQAAENEIKHKDKIILSLEQSGSQTDASLPINCPPAPKLICPDTINDSSSITDLTSGSGEITSVRNELAKSKNQIDILSAQKEKDSLWFEQTITARDQEISQLKAKLVSTDQQLLALKGIQNSSSKDSARAGLAVPEIISPKRAAKQNAAINAEEAQLKPESAKSLRTKALKELALIKELSQQRDQVYKEFAASGKSLQIKPSSSQSSTKRSLEQLQKDIDQENSVQILSLMQKEVSEIKQQLIDDIELAKRVSKL
jgi:hypothetical protein